MVKKLCILLLFVLSCGSSSSDLVINENNESNNVAKVSRLSPVFNGECEYSLEEALNLIYTIGIDNELKLKINWVEADSKDFDEKCLNKVVGSNLPQGSLIENNSKVELVVAVYRDPPQLISDENASLSEEGMLPEILDVYEGAELVELINTEAVVTDIEPLKSFNQLLVVMQSKEFIYFYNNDTNTLEPLFRFTNNIDTEPSTEGGIVKIQVIDDDYLLVAYHNKNMELIIKQFNLLENNIEESAKTLYREKIYDSVHHCLDMEYDSKNNILYFCRGDSTMQIDLIAQQAHLYDGKIHRFAFSSVNGLVPLPISSDRQDFVKVFPNTYPEKLESIYAIGLRNPFQIHLSDDGVLYIPDVGEKNIEELNVIKVDEKTNLVNFGWPFFEGTLKKDINQDEMTPSEYDEYINNLISIQTKPYLQYRHEDTPAGYRCAIIGGTTYKGQESNAWKNKYLFADYCTGEIMTLFGEYPNFRVLNLIQLSYITAIKNDLDGEILIATAIDPGSKDGPGKIYALKLP